VTLSPAARDTILFLAGLALLIFEAVGRTQEPRWGLLVLYGYMMGLPVVLRRDEHTSTSSPLKPPPGEIVP
jgi:hypothetical protein